MQGPNPKLNNQSIMYRMTKYRLIHNFLTLTQDLKLVPASFRPRWGSLWTSCWVFAALTQRVNVKYQWRLTSHQPWLSASQNRLIIKACASCFSFVQAEEHFYQANFGQLMNWLTREITKKFNQGQNLYTIFTSSELAQSLLNYNSEPICNYCCNNRSCLRANRVKIRENQCSWSVWDSKGLMVWRAVVFHAGSHVWHLKVKINSFRIFFLERKF